MGTTTPELDEAARAIFARSAMPIAFCGVFPGNKLPPVLLNEFITPPINTGATAKSMCCILNTDPSFMDGTHWVALYREPYSPLEFFDSLGSPPSAYGFHFPDSCQFNNQPLQSFTSSLCGEYCLLFLYLRSLYTLETTRSLPKSKFRQTCSKLADLAYSCPKRDVIVRKFYNSIRKAIPLHTHHSQVLSVLHYTLDKHPALTTHSYC